jgi:hypothetical protein
MKRAMPEWKALSETWNLRFTVLPSFPTFDVPRGLSHYGLNSRTISTQAFTFSTGVSGRMP